MAFDGLKLVLVLITGLGSFIAWMRERDLIKAGQAEAVANALRGQADAISKGNAAREAARSDLAAHPDRVRDPDEFTRPD